MKTLLNIGSGYHHALGNDRRFLVGEWEEIRVDLDPDTEPDIVADAREVPLPDGYADAVFSSHVLEHIPETDLAWTLVEWRRLLKPDGELVVAVPNLQVAAAWIANGAGWQTMYFTPNDVPIRPIDMVYGYAGSVGGSPLMGHRTGFTAETLGWWLGQAGFVGEVYPVEDNTGLEVTARKNGREPTFPDEPTILMKGSSMETQPDQSPEKAPDEPQEAAQEPEESSEEDGPQSRVTVDDAAAASVE
jgi:predicted SAM-dependent methyltransferase